MIFTKQDRERLERIDKNLLEHRIRSETPREIPEFIRKLDTLAL